VAALSQPTPNDELGRQRRERHRRELALDYAAGRIDEPGFLPAVAALRAEPDAAPPGATVSAADVSRYLGDLSGSLRQLEGMVASGDLGEQERAAWWAQMISAVYARITVAGLGFVGAQLSPTAERHGLALALPEQVRPEWRARPGSNPRHHTP